MSDSNVQDMTTALVATHLWQKLELSIRQNGGLKEDLAILAGPERDYFISMLTRRIAAIGTMNREACVVPVNYDMPYSEQFVACGFSGAIHEEVQEEPEKHLVQVPSGTHKQRIVRFYSDHRATTDEIVAEMSCLNLRPTSSHETLAYATANPKAQQQFNFIGLGSVWPDCIGDYRVLYLLGAPSVGRFVSFAYKKNDWAPKQRFLAIHNR